MYLISWKKRLESIIKIIALEQNTKFNASEFAVSSFNKRKRDRIEERNGNIRLSIIRR
jgi:hypothetical protein